MFRSYIYLDEDKLHTYMRQICGDNSATPKSITQKKSVGFNAGLKGVGVKSEIENNISAENQKDVSFDYDKFELALSKLDGEDYFDFVLNADYDLTTIPAMKIIRICNSFNIPEQFDVVDLMDRLATYLFRL